jgi:hypothetical protein
MGRFGDKLKEFGQKTKRFFQEGVGKTKQAFKDANNFISSKQGKELYAGAKQIAKTSGYGKEFKNLEKQAQTYVKPAKKIGNVIDAADKVVNAGSLREGLQGANKLAKIANSKSKDAKSKDSKPKRKTTSDKAMPDKVVPNQKMKNKKPKTGKK